MAKKGNMNINNEDFEKDNADEIECKTHGAKNDSN